MIEAEHKAWLEARGIPSTLAEKMELRTVTSKSGESWLSIPYRLDGELVNRKFRKTVDKEHRMDRGGRLCFWNADTIKGVGEVIITEGEFDALAVMAAGFERVVSVPNGAPAEKLDDPLNANRYAFLWDQETALKEIESFVLATDGDKPGRALAHDLAAILGPERCKFITYPEGSKDLNDVLVKHGEREVVRLIAEAKRFPVQGLYLLSDFPDEIEVQSMAIGVPALEEHMALVLGTFTVFSGYSNMGKSTVMNDIIGQCIARNVPVCVASFETTPKPILRDGIARSMIGCSFNQFQRHPDKQSAYDQIERRLTVISNALDDDTDIDLDRFLELCRMAVIRDGAKLIVLDPWNELEHKRGSQETETDYIGRAIRALKRFARRYNVALWVVAHPTKPQGKTGPPGLYDIAGSANWANKADYGLIYHRPDKAINSGTLSVVKVRMGLPGGCGIVDVMLDEGTSRIVATS
jgi:twinkle protein